MRNYSLMFATIVGLMCPRLASAQTCEALSSLKLPDTSITAATSVAAGAFTAPGRGGRGGNQFADLPAFCRVEATLKPSADSDIKVEYWLPATASAWNGKFQATGNGGWNGNIDQNALAAGLRRGYAAASTDTGHQGGGGPWMQNREKMIDYGHRAVHEMTVRGKAIATAFYNSAPKLSYFTGCSAGGRQGLIAAQRYPEDFDGIVAGAPALNATGRAVFSMYVAQNLHKDEAAYIPATKYPAIHDAVLAACDSLDGVKDRVIENPLKCKFDPKVMACSGADSPTCLTEAQINAARKMYQAVVNTKTKKEIFPGLAYGSELGWATFGSPQPFGIGAQMFQFMVFNDQNWDYKTLNFDEHMALVDKAEAGLINARDPNLSKFTSRGGKLIQYHGWSDPQIPSASSTQYYQSVLDKMGGASKVTDSYRLFMVPGMNHCGGGDGTATFDMLTALENWVEKKQAPASIPASHVTEGKVDRTRPLCPFPQVASYKGTGSTDDAANFVCKQ
ncbi:MAG TPA: tannase/feruloyl esterase family alpha/beta hydrolase [Vicinamibacterales bacterium]